MKNKLFLFPLMVLVILITTLGVGGGIALADTSCEHEYAIETVSPTCSKEGYTLYKCTKCGEIYQDNFVNTLEHEYILVTIEPDCIHKGYTTYICTNCGYSYQTDFVDPLGHTYVDEVISPTCCESGYTKHTCSVCHDEYIDSYVSPLGHDYSSIVTDSDCINKGYTTYTCNTCGYSYIGDYVDELGHDFILNTVDPTCTTYGYTEHVCSRCKDRFVTDYINPLEHEYEIKNVVATNTTYGYTVYSCTHCDYSYVSKISTSKDDGYVYNSKDQSETLEDENEDINPGISEDEENKESGGEDKTEQENKEIEVIKPEEEIIVSDEHIHNYLLDVRIKEESKSAIVKFVCECGDVNNDDLTVTLTKDGGTRYDLIINSNYIVDLYPYEGEYSFSVFNGTDEIFLYDITLPKNNVDEDKDTDISEDAESGSKVVEPEKEDILSGTNLDQTNSNETGSGLSKTAEVLIAVFSVLLALAISGVVAIVVIKKKSKEKKDEGKDKEKDTKEEQNEQ